MCEEQCGEGSGWLAVTWNGSLLCPFIPTLGLSRASFSQMLLHHCWGLRDLLGCLSPSPPPQQPSLFSGVYCGLCCRGHVRNKALQGAGTPWPSPFTRRSRWAKPHMALDSSVPCNNPCPESRCLSLISRNAYRTSLVVQG